MEKEPKIEKSREDKLREKGYQIERAQLSEDESMQCDKCMDKDKDFQFYQDGWFIDGEFCCSKHKEGAINALEEIGKDVERRKLERERVIEERIKKYAEVEKEWAGKGENLELREKLEQKRREIEQRQKNKES